MKVFEVQLAITVLVAGEDQGKAEDWAEANGAEVIKGNRLESIGCRLITDRGALRTAGHEDWAEAIPYGLPTDDERTVDDLLPADPAAPYRCDQTLDMFT